jgi:hypothetical protein
MWEHELSLLYQRCFRSGEGQGPHPDEATHWPAL